VEKEFSPRLAAILDVANLFENFSPTAHQNNSYLIRPPGYKGGNPTYALCYGQVLAGTVPCRAHPVSLQVRRPIRWSTWNYGTDAYIPQSYPLGRIVQIRLRYRL
jgi:hypothetical protein